MLLLRWFSICIMVPCTKARPKKTTALGSGSVAVNTPIRRETERCVCSDTPLCRVSPDTLLCPSLRICRYADPCVYADRPLPWYARSCALRFYTHRPLRQCLKKKLGTQRFKKIKIFNLYFIFLSFFVVFFLTCQFCLSFWLYFLFSLLFQFCLTFCLFCLSIFLSFEFWSAVLFVILSDFSDILQTNFDISPYF